MMLIGVDHREHAHAQVSPQDPSGQSTQPLKKAELSKKLSTPTPSDPLILLKENYAFIDRDYHRIGQLKLGAGLNEFIHGEQWSIEQIDQPSFIQLMRVFKPGDSDRHYLFGSSISRMTLSFLDQKLVQIELEFSLQDEKSKYSAELDQKIVTNFQSIYQKLGHPTMTLTPSVYIDEVYEAEELTRDIILRKYRTQRTRGLWKNDRYSVSLDRLLSQKRQDLNHSEYTQSITSDRIVLSLTQSAHQDLLTQRKLDLTQRKAEQTNELWYKHMTTQSPKTVCPDPLSCIMRGLEAREFRDYAKAAFFFDMACRRRELKGCVSLGVLYSHGRGVDQNKRKAFKLFQKSCRGGHISGCTNLGVMYEDGAGVKKNHRKAIKLYTKACNQGYGKACGNLGVIFYADGDKARGALYDARACEEGDVRGCSNLGYDYEHGAGVRQNVTKARLFYTKACQKGYGEACQSLKRLSK